MAEVLLCVRSMTAPEFYTNCGLPKRGDVIAISGDGSSWSVNELQNPNWRIIRLVGVSTTDVSGLLIEDMPSKLPADRNTSKTRQYRGTSLNLDDVTIPAAYRVLAADDTRSTPIIVVPNAAALVTKLTTKRPPIADPAVIG